MARKPNKRPDIPARHSDNDKRRLDSNLDPERITTLYTNACYKGHPKHKRNPRPFGLDPYRGRRGDETLCDEHANFGAADIPRIPALLKRGICAGLIGGRLLWTVDDNGWIFEGRLTNPAQSEYHGYPVRPSEAIAKLVYNRFAEWAAVNNLQHEQKVARACADLYGFK